MSIPTLTADLAVIQKLADLPNSTDGLTAQELKARFDRAGLEIQTWINESLVPALQAQNIPFAASAQINAANVQDAIAAVQGQIRDAATGTIVNGSVTKEKLASDLLARVFGGLPWVSMEEPDSGDNPNAGFPVGQVWLRHGFTVNNAAGDSWTCNGCTVTDGVVTGDKTAAVATAVQSLTDLGQTGDRVLVLFGIQDKNQEVSSITVAFNGGAAQDASGGVFETALLTGGALQVQFTTTWSSAALAQDGWTLKNYTVVNLDAAVRQAAGAKEIGDWETYLKALLPFTSYSVPDALYIQTGSGVWRQLVTAPEVESGYFRVAGGKLLWSDRDQVAEDLGALRMKQGSYTGTGEEGTQELNVVPKVLMIGTKGEVSDVENDHSNGKDNPLVLLNGTSAVKSFSVSYDNKTVLLDSTVSLSESTLTFSGSTNHGDNAVRLMNRKGVEYVWTAIY